MSAVQLVEREQTRLVQMTVYERPFWDRGLLVAGLDEAGRGPLAGPVVAAAVVFEPDALVEDVNDSKLLTPDKRSELFQRVTEKALDWAVGMASPEEIDRLNILRASHLAMKRALEKLQSLPVHALVDGLPVSELPVPHTAIVKGDQRCYSVAAASIVAKVVRDEIMRELDELYPGYGFARHKGYPTEEHVLAIHRLGLSPVHRRSFHVRSLAGRGGVRG